MAMEYLGPRLEEFAQGQGLDEAGLGKLRRAIGTIKKVLPDVNLDDLGVVPIRNVNLFVRFDNLMDDKETNFSPAALAALERTKVEAEGLDSSYMGVEHLLLGLEEDIVSLLVDTNDTPVEPRLIRGALKFILGVQEKSDDEQKGYTPRLKRVIEIAAGEARALSQKQITPGILLLGILAEGESIANGVLESLGATHESVQRAYIGQLLS